MVDVKTVCLGVLSEGAASGYEIKKKIEEGPYSLFVDASYGSIYPALTRLAKDGFVEFHTAEQDGRPDKKIYTITQAGRLQFLDQLARAPGDDRYRSDFLFYIVFSDLIAPQRISEMIDEQIARYRRKIQMIVDCTKTSTRSADTQELNAAGRFAADHGRAILEAAIRHLEENRHLVEAEALMSREPVRASAAQTAGI